MVDKYLKTNHKYVFIFNYIWYKECQPYINHPSIAYLELPINITFILCNNSDYKIHWSNMYTLSNDNL